VTPGPFSRRALLVALPALACAGGAMAADDAWAQLPARFAELEKESGGRLGIAALDVKTGRTAAHRGDERFPLASTFKFLAAAAVLARVDAGAATLDKNLGYTQADLVTYSPVTKDHAGSGMTLAAICEAAVTLSDNTAGNLMLRELGGPEGLTAFLRKSGDGVTRLDRWETALNEAAPGDPRDTTTPNAMVANLRRFVLGDALKPGSREKLAGWLKGCRTSADRMRAGLPPGWIVGDKTGSGERGTMNDVGIIWPPDGAPILLAIYLTASDKPQAERAKIHSEAGRLVASAARP
jgi:beta-lactamase class A